MREWSTHTDGPRPRPVCPPGGAALLTAETAELDEIVAVARHQDRARGRQLPSYAFRRPSLGASLTGMYPTCIFVHMRTTLNIDETLLSRAAHLTGVREKTSLVRLGLEALIARESARRLAELGGSENRLRPIRRRRPPA